MAVGHSYFPLLRLGQPGLAAIHLPVIAGIPQSLGKDATLTNILQMLDKHYGVVTIFNTLSKELYSLKQGSGENVARFRV